MIDLLGWAVNIIAVIGWCVNIRYRFYAMLIFTVSTVLSIIYFSQTQQESFLLRSIFYLLVDIVTVRQCIKERTLK